MKVLAISTSPRMGGNSDVLCDEFLKGAMEAGHSCKKIRLATKKLNPCRACYACSKTHECIQKDDGNEILQEMLEADVWVLGVPVYFYSMASQLKMMIDRCLPCYLQMKDKQIYIVVTAADPNHEAADVVLEEIRGFERCLPGCREKGIVYGTGTWQKGDVYHHPAMKDAFEMGKKIAESKRRRKRYGKEPIF